MSYVPSSYNAALSTYNLTESSFRIGRAALATGLNNTAGTPTRILCLGDSITQGVTSTPERLYNWPARLRSALTASGLFGTVGEGLVVASGQTIANYDERWTAGTGWGRNNGGIGATMWQAAPGSGTLSFALPSCDTVKVWYTQHSINGTWTYDVDGGTAQTVNANGATAILSSTFAIGSVGTHVLNIHPNATTGYTMIQAVEYSTTASRNKLEVVTGGGYNGVTSTWLTDATNNSTGFNLQALMAATKPDIALVCIGRNDANPANGVTMAQYQTNITNLVTWQRSASPAREIMFLSPPPASTTTYTNDAPMRAAIKSVCDTYNVAYIDLNARFGPNWNIAPYAMSGDNIHPNDAGNFGLANAVSAAIRF